MTRHRVDAQRAVALTRTRPGYQRSLICTERQIVISPAWMMIVHLTSLGTDVGMAGFDMDAALTNR